MSKAVIAISGGMDSAVLYALAKQIYDEVDCIFFDYQQTHFEGERAHAANFLCNSKFGEPHEGAHFDLPVIRSKKTGLLKGGPVELPDGDSSLCVMSGRNMIFIAYLLHWAMSKDCDVIGIGVNAADLDGFPDCRPRFIDCMAGAVLNASEGKVSLWTPLLTWSKAWIVSEGTKLDIDWTLTWSCYREGVRHCGTCHACQTRKQGFKEAGIEDPTIYDA